MIRTVTAKTAAGKRALKRKTEARVVEQHKQALFVKGSTTSQDCTDALLDLYAMKKTNSVLFTKRNDIHPFTDFKPLEHFSTKNDTSLIVLTNHSKKRPHNLTFIRMFDHQVMDMVEFGIKEFFPMAIFETPKPALGLRPSVVFVGSLFETDSEYAKIKNILLDFFRGDATADAVNLKGLEHVISFTASSTDSHIHMRCYTSTLKKSAEDPNIPRVELNEVGPVMELELRRRQFAPDDLFKFATRVPKEAKPKKEKNVERDLMGDKLGRVHMAKQDFSKLQTRKMKGLKHGRDDDDEEGDEETASVASSTVPAHRQKKKKST